MHSYNKPALLQLMSWHALTQPWDTYIIYTTLTVDGGLNEFFQVSFIVHVILYQHFMEQS